MAPVDRSRRNARQSRPSRQLGYAVVGLGHIAQAAVLPGFSHASENSRVAALVSDNPAKRSRLGREYGVKHLYSYDRFDECLQNEEVDAVFIALPNSMHRDFAVRAARAGVHVLCEKPMATSERECEDMIRAADDADVKLMIAYRLHFEPANLAAVELARSGRIGEPRIFESVFSYQVRAGNIRLKAGLGGGPLWDIGIYCVNAARYLFGSEPLEVFAFASRGRDKRFAEVEEGLSAVLRFPDDRFATFTCSFGTAAAGSFRLVGTKGSLALDNAYEYKGPRVLTATVGDKGTRREFEELDQFGPELAYFSDCVLRDRVPEPSGVEGLADVRVIRALYRSSATGRSVAIKPVQKGVRPGAAQRIRRRPTRPADMVGVEAPVQD